MEASMAIFGAIKKAVFGSPNEAYPLKDTAYRFGLHSAIVDELLVSSHLSEWVPKAALIHVAQGGQEVHLEKLGNFLQTTPQGHMPGISKFREEVALKRQAVDIAIMRGEIVASPQFERYIQVRMTLDKTYHWSPVAPQDPVVAATKLILDAIVRGFNATRVNHEIQWQDAVNLRGVLALIGCCGGSLTDAFGALLSQSYSLYSSPGNWFQSAEFGHLMRSYTPAFIAGWKSVSTGIQSQTLRLLEYHNAIAIPAIFDLVMEMTGKGYTKQEQELAILALAKYEPTALADFLREQMPKADADKRLVFASIAGRSGAPVVLAVLAEQLKVEKSAKIKAAIAALITATSHCDEAESGADQPISQYKGINGDVVIIPQIALEELALSEADCRAATLEMVEILKAGRVRQRLELAEKYPERLENTPLLGDQTNDRVFELISGYAVPKDFPNTPNQRDFYYSRDQTDLLKMLQAAPRAYALRVAAWLSGGGFEAATKSSYSSDREIWTKLVHDALSSGFDLRLYAVLCQRASNEQGFKAEPVKNNGDGLRMLLPNGYSWPSWEFPFERFTKEAVWPWVAENMGALDQGLGLAPTPHPLNLVKTLTYLATLPQVPYRYYERLLELALTEKKDIRPLAVKLLEQALGLTARLEAALDDQRQPVRINAAAWLADARAVGSEGALRKRLKKERSDLVRTALIKALERLGADLSDVIGPASLIAEAKAATAKTAPAVPEWLSLLNAPPAQFRDGQSLPADVLAYWLSLAIKLKDPAATGQFGIYLDQLEPADAQALSGWVLDCWVTYDTKTATLEEVNAFAAREAPNDWRVKSVHKIATVEQVFEEIRRSKMGQIVNSGTDTKGMLALACRAKPAFAADRVRWYLKKHGRRSHQAMALLDMLAGIGSSTALQVVIAASVRLKQKSTQQHAANIAQRYAQDRGWTIDELADRTVPTAGFDDDGNLDLPCGEDDKAYYARLDAALNIHLFNPEDKPIKALPAGDDDASKESKKSLSNGKKELKQVVDMQTSRLFEAMCVERTWPVADWRMAFHDHPVMRRLIERLVWQGIGEDGTGLGLFRPTQEGDFTDAADANVDVDSYTEVRLAHGALVDDATSKAWVDHLANYEINPLIVQFGQTRAALTQADGDTTMIEDRKGWVANSMTYRGIGQKRGYERVMGDGGGCNEYVKTFSSHGLIATIHHTGSYAEDENNLVALTGLSFAKGQYSGAMKLKDVPPVMLAECWADFHTLASKGAFQDDWEKISPW
jgi:hypothetical protein